MSKKDKHVGAEAHQNSAARLESGGFLYSVVFTGGTILEFADEAYLEVVVERWKTAAKEDTLFSFSGAKETVDGPVIGAGTISGRDVRAIIEGDARGEGPEDDDEEYEDEEDEEGGTGFEVPQGYLLVKPVEQVATAAPEVPAVSDDDLAAEGGFKS